MMALGGWGPWNPDPAAALAGTATYQELLTTRDQDRGPSPILAFFRFTNGEDVLRVVDGFDPDRTAQNWDGKISFAGDDYTATSISRTSLDERTGGAFPNTSISLGDPRRELQTYFRSRELTDLRCEIEIIRQDDIETPSSRLRPVMRLHVLEVQSSEGPPQLSVRMGAPADSLRAPWLTIQRDSCPAFYGGRFNNRNLCTYPSDEFDAGTSYTLFAPLNERTETKFGWSAENIGGSGVSQLSGSWSEVKNGALTFRRLGTDLRWVSGVRNGPIYTKEIPAGELDFHALARIEPTANKAGGIYGVCIQNAALPSEALFFGITGSAWVVRQISAQGDVDQTGPEARSAAMLRIHLDDDVWRFSIADPKEDRGVEWSAVSQIIHPSLGNRWRVGLFAQSNSLATAGSLAGKFDFFRFDAGGLSSCSRNLGGPNGCRAHNQEHQYLAVDTLVERLR